MNAIGTFVGCCKESRLWVGYFKCGALSRSRFTIRRTPCMLFNYYCWFVP